MALQISPSAMASLWARADAQGAPWTTPISRYADFSAGCESLITREYETREDLFFWFMRRHPKNRLWRFHGGASFLNAAFDDRMAAPPKVYFVADLPCRKCGVCLRRRELLWRRRAQVEVARASRTWFCTFTINPENRFRIDCARHSVGSDDDAFMDRHARLSREFTLYFKRVRKTSRVGIRYLLVAEQHEDGWPHYHALLHEAGQPVTKRLLESEWLLGFTHFKLIPFADMAVARYVTKYIAKQALARIRASLRYGAAL